MARAANAGVCAERALDTVVHTGELDFEASYFLSRMQEKRADLSLRMNTPAPGTHTLAHALKGRLAQCLAQDAHWGRVLRRCGRPLTRQKLLHLRA